MCDIYIYGEKSKEKKKGIEIVRYKDGDRERKELKDCKTKTEIEIERKTLVTHS